MYDSKRVRRRRAVLGLLVGLSLILLTAYFGESVSGPFHSIQRGVVAVLSPIQEGASRALKPVRDLIGWFGDTIDAKGERRSLRHEIAQLRREVVGAQAALEENVQLRKLVALDGAVGLGRLGQVAARVTGRSPTLWYATIEVDRGTDDGVHVDDPVLSGDGLVGKVTDVTPVSSVVTLITDHTSGVSARVLEPGRVGDPGVVVPSFGNPEDLIIQNLPPGPHVSVGDQVVTAGWRSSRPESLFPPNIPIGQITRVSADELSSQQAHLRPAADLRRLDVVQILTRPNPGLRAQLP